MVAPGRGTACSKPAGSNDSQPQLPVPVSRLRLAAEVAVRTSRVSTREEVASSVLVHLGVGVCRRPVFPTAVR